MGVTLSVGEAGWTMILQFLVTVPAVDPEESVTCAVKKLNGSGVAGVPVIAPVLVFKLSPEVQTSMIENV